MTVCTHSISYPSFLSCTAITDRLTFIPSDRLYTLGFSYPIFVQHYTRLPQNLFFFMSSDRLYTFDFSSPFFLNTIPDRLTHLFPVTVCTSSVFHTPFCSALYQVASPIYPVTVCTHSISHPPFLFRIILGQLSHSFI